MTEGERHQPEVAGRRAGRPTAAPGAPGAGQSAPSRFEHQPVLWREVVELLRPVPTGLVVDATVGGGGHAAAILETRPDLAVLGLDVDEEAVGAAHERLARFGRRAVVRHARFDSLAAEVARWTPPMRVVGVLFDLGVSSPQLDRPDRGFSYRFDGPLDMRMDRHAQRTAADVVNDASEAELARLFAEHGEGRLARRLARAVVAARPLESTAALAAVVAAAVPPARRRRGHPARRVFQALRVVVNDELATLERTLPTALDLLAPGGRCIAIAYHSGEDRIVKAAFRQAATGGCRCPAGLPCGCGAVPTVRLLGAGARKPSAEEVDRNPRAESARLRACERLALGPDARSGQ